MAKPFYNVEYFQMFEKTAVARGCTFHCTNVVAEGYEVYCCGVSFIFEKF